MGLLVLGLALWCGVHLFPAVAPDARAGLIQRAGLNPYRGLFALLIVASVVLMVLGWRSAGFVHVYPPPVWGRHLTMLFVLIAFILFCAARAPTNLKRVIRHPQLIGVHVWGIGHLLANGDLRSVLLFGTFAVWPIVEISFINRREGAWQKPARQPVRGDIVLVVIATILYAVIAHFHGWLFGMPAILR